MIIFTMESAERKKLYIVIGLAAIFAATGYFRFLHGRVAFFSQPGRSVANPAMIEVPAVDLKGLQPAGQPQKKMAPAGPRTGIRDIFAPVKAPAKKIAAKMGSVTAADLPLKPLPALKLTGTIIGGKQPLAVINGQILRNNEMIAGFKVVSIAKDQVIISGEGRKVMLNILTGPEEQSP
jgi:hypothetical protein